ncbi:MAG: fumarylacetoacetase [Bryobacteraceae bacterium]
MYALNETHDPDLTSSVASANLEDARFPIQNLPLGVFALPDGEPRIGSAIGDQILDLRACAETGLITGPAAGACQSVTLNWLMSLTPEIWSGLRLQLSRLLRKDSQAADLPLHPQLDCTMLLPATIGDYTDFYASVFHATNVGGMFRPDNPLLPNYKYVPIGYHGRASSVVASGTAIRRPHGQIQHGNTLPPVFGRSSQLDYECEVGAFIGQYNPLFSPVPIAEAEDHLFGLCLLNDWSARDIQRWEYQPLGPFLAKSFATTISPWIVTAEALAPFRVPRFVRPDADPQPLDYLDDPQDHAQGGFNLSLTVSLSSVRMRHANLNPIRLSFANFRDMYWTFAQMIAHHASNGCNLRPGDLLGSGTVSGPGKDARGCLLELTWRGTEPLQLPSGESRKFLEDMDEVTISGFCDRPGFRGIGFGECRGVIVA